MPIHYVSVTSTNGLHFYYGTICFHKLITGLFLVGVFETWL